MPSMNDENRPLRSREVLLEQVYRRGRQLRRRRQVFRVAVGVVAALALVVPAVGLSALVLDSDSSLHVGTAPSGKETEDPYEADSSPSPTATVSPESPKSTPSISPSPSPSPSSPSPPPPVCTPAEVEVVTTTDRSSYQTGEEVKVTSTVTNRSNHICHRAEAQSVAFRDSEGTTWFFYYYPSAEYGPGYSPEWAPGETLTTSYSWNQKTCKSEADTACQPAVQAPPGTYIVEVEWRWHEAFYKASATFEIVGAS